MLAIRSVYALLAAIAFLQATSVRAQLRANGYIDTAFNQTCVSSPSVNFSTFALHVQPDGRIVAGGNYSTGVGACRNAILRLNTNGTTDGSFQMIFSPNDFVTSIATQSTGRLVVGGRMTDFSSTFPVARLNANGTMEANFQRNNLSPLFIANAVVVQSDDKIVVGGLFQGFGGAVVRLGANGAIDATFSDGVTDAGLSGLGVTALALQNGKVLVGGSFTFYEDGAVTSNRSGLARLNENGSLDKTFIAPLTNADVRSLLLQPDGKILVAGRFNTHGGDRFVTRLNSDGTRDSSFTSVGPGTTGLSLALQPDGKILVGHALGVMRLNSDGTQDLQFGPRNADGFFGTAADNVFSVAATPNGEVIAGAWRVRVSNTERRGIARLFGSFPPPPGITQQPVSATVEAGTNVTFSVIATGAPPVTFQWRKDGKNINQATNNVLNLLDVDSTDRGAYTVVVSNPGGAVTSVVAKLTIAFHVSPITLLVNGSGTVTPNLLGKALEIGRSYTVTATPAKGFLFSHWAGGFVSTNVPVLTFVMVTNMVLEANFVPSPFIPVRGAYAGLFYEAIAPAHRNAGDLNLTLDDKGGFRGTVRTGKKPRKFAGTFSLDRTAQVAIPAAGTQPPLAIDLRLNIETESLEGIVTITGQTNTATLSGFRKVFSSTLNPAPNAGLYNAALPGSDDAEVAPAGDGFIPLVVNTAGRVSGKGALADGTAFNLVSATSAGGWVPVYVPMYGDAGSIVGWLNVSNTGGNDVAGTLWWTKPASPTGLYPNGFTEEISVIGSRFVAVAKGAPVLDLPAGLAVVSFGNLVDPLTANFALGGDNKIVGDSGLTLTLSPTKGTATGSFIDPNTSRKRTVRGVVLQNQNEARGFFLGTDQSGRLWVGSE